MARPELKNRQFTIYTRDDGDLPRWKELCPPLTLNGWILEMIEKGQENKLQIRTHDTQELNSLRKENVELKKELEIIRVKLQEKEDLEKDYISKKADNPMLDKEIIDILKTEGCLDSVQITEHALVAETMKDTSRKGPFFIKIKRQKNVP